jgi:hypothetical protein
MKNLELEKMNVASLKQVKLTNISAGQNPSEIQFLMDANGWSRAQACEVLGLADQYACMSSNPCTGVN